MLVGVWLAGVSLLTVRLLGGWMWVQRMKRHASTGASRELQGMVVRLSKRLHISRTVRLLQSSAVVVPTVIGCLRPVILFPVSALAGMSPTQIESILAHELAHIRRHDYLVNLLQTLLETLLFYHPAVWWLSRRIRDERENCCDDLAVSLCGDPVAYARALADLEEHRGSRGSAGDGRQRRRAAAADPPAAGGRADVARRPRPGLACRHPALVLVAGIGVTVVITAPRTELRSGNTQTTPVPAVRRSGQRLRRMRDCARVRRVRRVAKSAESATRRERRRGATSAPVDRPRQLRHHCGECADRAAPSAASTRSHPSALRRTLCLRQGYGGRVAPVAPSPESAPSAPHPHPQHRVPPQHRAPLQHPAARLLSIHTSGSGQKSSGNMSWSHNGERARSEVRRGVRVQ